MIEAWGIPDSSHVPLAIQALRLRFPLFAVPILVCALAAGLMQDMISYLSLVLVSLPCLAGMVTAAWRISILKKRHFQSLSRWLLSLLGSEPKRP